MRYVKVKNTCSDTSLYIILLHAATMDGISISFDIRSGNKKTFVNFTDMTNNYTPDNITALVALHAFYWVRQR